MLTHYFNQHITQLEKNYPGINLSRILNDGKLWQEKNGLQNNWFDFNNKLNQGHPLQYIVNEAYFFNLPFYVDEQVLIPRYETEILVEKALNLLAQAFPQKAHVLDVGTGSGAIGLSIAHAYKGQLNLTLTDICPKALKVAQYNFYKLAYSLRPQLQINFEISDRLFSLSSSQKFDLIVSNPPYLTSDQKIHTQVLTHEPSLALVLPKEQYFTWYKTFFKQVSNLLSSGGHFLMEGDEEYLPQLLNLAKETDLFTKQSKITMINDYQDKPRFIWVQT